MSCKSSQVKHVETDHNLILFVFIVLRTLSPLTRYTADMSTERASKVHSQYAWRQTIPRLIEVVGVYCI